MQSWLSFEVDGREVRAEHLSTRRTLADFLELESRSLSVNEPWQGGRLVGMLDGDVEGLPVYRTIDASLLLLVQAEGRVFVTPAGLLSARGTHPVARLLAGYPLLDCDGDGIANILMCLFEAYHRDPGDFAIPRRIAGQFDACLGRTTDYPRLRNAAMQLLAAGRTADSAAAEWSAPLDGAMPLLPELQYLDSDKRRFYRPQTLVDALKLRKQYENAIWVAGGTDLGEKAWRDSADWDVMISLDGIAELRAIFASGDDEIEIGAAAPLTVIADYLGGEFPVFRKMLRRFGSRAVRNRATLGGHLASASPCGDLWPVLMAMDAKARIVTIDSERDVPVASFAVGPGETTLRPGEVIRSIVVPRATPAALSRKGVEWRFCEAYKAAQRRNLSRAMVVGAFCIDLDAKGMVQNAVLAYSGITDRPVRARGVEKSLIGKPWDERTVIAVLQDLDKEINVTRDDGLASLVYRRQLVITLFQKFFYQYANPATAGRELGAISDFLKRKSLQVEAAESVAKSEA